MVGGQHEDDALLFIHPIKEAVIPDAIPPSLGHGVPQLLNIFPKVGVLAKLRIDVRGQLLLDASVLSSKVLLEIALKLRGLEETELSQQIYLSAASRRGARP